MGPRRGEMASPRGVIGREREVSIATTDRRGGRRFFGMRLVRLVADWSSPLVVLVTSFFSGGGSQKISSKYVIK